MVGFTETELRDKAESAVRELPEDERYGFAFGYMRAAVTNGTYTPADLTAIANGLNEGLEQE